MAEDQSQVEILKQEIQQLREISSNQLRELQKVSQKYNQPFKKLT